MTAYAACSLALLATFLPALADVEAPPDASSPAALRDAAVLHYDAGRYAEAMPLLRQLDSAGAAEGSDLYRLHYCERAAGENDAAMGTLQRAIALLESEVAIAKGLEAPFYLANALTNLGRAADARRVAAAATERVASGEIAAPSDGIERFRLGKLHADQNNEEDAAIWYARALEAFAAEPSTSSAAYVGWAGRYLGQRAYDEENWIDAERFLGAAAEAGEMTLVELERLAVARARLGLYAEAAAAWRRGEKVDPANAATVRYNYRLAESAIELAVSAAAPDGRLWTQMTRVELEALLVEQAAAVRAVQVEARDSAPLADERRAELQGQLDARRPVFVGAALEYALRGYGIREAAFSGGYAPLIFKAQEWRLR